MATDQSGPNRPERTGGLSRLKRRAKELLRSYRSGDPQAVETVAQHFDGADPKRFRLAQAQLVLARSLGFPSWTKLRASVDAPVSRKRRPRTRPDRMREKRYVYDVDAVDGDQAWALFEACRDGDAQAVRSLLETDPNLVHAQNWYTQPNHFAVYANQPGILRILLEAGAEPGRSRFMDSGWQKLLDRSKELGFQGCHDVLCDVLRKRFGFDPEFARLEAAIRSRDRTRIEDALAELPDLVKACDPSGNNAVHWAVLTRQPELFALLADLGTDLEHCRSDGQTPAHVLFNGDYTYRTRRELKGMKYPDEATVLRALLDAGAQFDLSIACATGDQPRVETILQRDPGAARRLDSGRRSPLMYAARAGHLEVVRTLLEHGADPNKPEELADSGAGLFEACCRGHREVAELLLEQGANPNAGSDSSGDCVHIAQRWAGDAAEPIVDLLRRHGATNPAWNMNVEEMSRALRDDEPISRELEFALEALARNDLELARQLLEKHPKLPEQLHGGCLRMGSPDVAITEGPVLKLLLEAGFDPNRPDWLGKTALHHYAGRGEVGNALLMIENGAVIDAVDDEYHGTPLAWAAREGHLETAQLLLAHGADPNLPLDISQATPLARARAGGHGEIVALLEGGEM